MYSWEVLCVEWSDDAEYTDCRGIEALGLNIANNVSKRPVDVAHVQLKKGQSAFHIDRDGETLPLQHAGEGSLNYVRTLNEDSESDPLAQLPTCAEFERSERLKGI